jgi:hypothetical protein
MRVISEDVEERQRDLRSRYCVNERAVETEMVPITRTVWASPLGSSENR